MKRQEAERLMRARLRRVEGQRVRYRLGTAAVWIAEQMERISWPLKRWGFGRRSDAMHREFRQLSALGSLGQSKKEPPA